MIRTLLAMLLVLAAFASAASPRASRDTLPTSALLSFQDVPEGEEGLRTLLDRLFQEAFKARAWRLMERQRVDAILAERSFQSASSCSTSCAAQIGTLLGVRTLLLPEFDRVDGVSTISLRELDVATGEVLRIAYVETDESIGSSSRRLARLLIGRLLGDPSVPETDSGWISVASDPPAEIWIDGVSVGTSPLTVPVWPGIHRVATAPGHVLPAPKPQPTAPDASATTIIVVDGGRDHHHRHHPRPRFHPDGPHGEAPASNRDHAGPSGNAKSGKSDGSGSAVAVGAVAAVAGVALVAAAASMPDSVWDETWKDAKAPVADTARVAFRKVENDGKGALGIIGVAALIFGVLVAAIALQQQ